MAMKPVTFVMKRRGVYVPILEDRLIFVEMQLEAIREGFVTDYPPEHKQALEDERRVIKSHH